MQARRKVSFKGFPDDGSENTTESPAASDHSDPLGVSQASLDDVSSSSGSDGSSLPGAAEEASLTSSAASGWITLQEAVSSVGAVSLLSCDAASDSPERSASRCSVALVLALVFAAACVAVIAVDHGLKLFTEHGSALVSVAGVSDAKLPPADPGAITQKKPNASAKGVLIATMAQPTSPSVSRRSVRARSKTTAANDSTVETSSEEDTTTSEEATHGRNGALYPTVGASGQSTPPQDRSESARKAHAPRSHPKTGRPVVRPECGAPQFTLCAEPRREFVYRTEAGRCTVAAQAASSFCNRSPNRFASLRSCRSSCVAAITPAQRCFDKPVLAGCSGNLIVSAWWFFNGHRCDQWQFPAGKCPVRGDVFRSRAQCQRECGAGRRFQSRKFQPPCAAFTDYVRQGDIQCYRADREDLAHACRFLARHHLAQKDLDAAYELAHKCTVFPETKEEARGLLKQVAEARALLEQLDPGGGDMHV